MSAHSAPKTHPVAPTFPPPLKVWEHRFGYGNRVAQSTRTHPKLHPAGYLEIRSVNPARVWPLMRRAERGALKDRPGGLLASGKKDLFKAASIRMASRTFLAVQARPTARCMLSEEESHRVGGYTLAVEADAFVDLVATRGGLGLREKEEEEEEEEKKRNPGHRRQHGRRGERASK